MSGGSMDYICYSIDEQADKLEDKELVELAHDFAAVFKAKEWELSGDTGIGNYRKVVKDFKAKWFGGDRNERLERYIDERVQEIKREMGFGAYCKDCSNFTAQDGDYGRCRWHTNVMMHVYDDTCDKFERRDD